MVTCGHLLQLSLTWSLTTLYCYNFSLHGHRDTLFLQRFLHGHLRHSIVTVFLCMITHDFLLLKYFPVWSLAAINYNFPLRGHLLPYIVITFICMVTGTQRFLHGHLRHSTVTVFLCMITRDLLLLKHFPALSLAAVYYNFPLHDHLRPSIVTTFPACSLTTLHGCNLSQCCHKFWSCRQTAVVH